MGKIDSIAAAIAKLPVNVQEQVFEDLYELKRAKKREEAQASFSKFVKAMWPGFIDGRHHNVMAKKFEEIAQGKLKRLIINMPPRHAVMTGMKIPTITGFKTMADLQVGDCVFGPDGLPVAVMGKSEVFRGRELYRVWTDDNSYLDVDGEHLWTVRLDRKHCIYKDYTTEQLWRRQNGEVLRTKRGGGIEFLPRKNADTPQKVRLPRLPDVAPVQYPQAQLPVDPYVLGLWLGDGTALQAIITMHTADALLVRSEVERRGYATTDQNTRFTFGIRDLKVKLRELGVLGNKHIPAQYLIASEAQRRDLLKGLMDTDGNVTKGGQCFFAQSNKALCEQVQELLRSLGVKANLLESRATLDCKDYGPTWKVSFYASDVVSLPRKAERTLTGERKFGRYIRIERLGYTGDTQCIKVDRDDGLFLAGAGYICTHNTKSEFASFMLPSWYLGLFPNKKIIQSSNTSELAVGFGRKVRNLVDSEAYAEIFPNVSLRVDSKAAGRWATNANGEYFAIGVGGTVTGKGADLLIIDDPHSEQEAKLAMSNAEVFDQVYEWYTSGPRQRLQPGGAIVVVMCMTGDTSVLMANGEEKHLRNLRPGDIVATFEKGKLTTAKVNNWQSSGVDSIYRIQTQSGKILRANERHPFLVMNEGVLEWTRLNQLMVGDELVSLKGASDQQGHKQKFSSELRRISDFTTDPIISIIFDGREEVFDVEVDRTENFIANGVVSHNTRWSKRDLTGRILQSMIDKDGEHWEVINFPAILPSGNPLWPEFWSLAELEVLRLELPASKWNAQYQQSPTSEAGAIVKREWWKIWKSERAPRCEFIIQSWDTAFTKSERSDYSACTTWGVFYMNENENDANIILLDAFKKRMEFPELKEKAFNHYKEWEPDAFIVEAKASGGPLIFELRQMGIPVSEFTPSRGNDKMVRINAVADLFSSGKIWAPETRWADELMEEMAAFPNSDHDDLVDSTTQALIRFRKGGFLRLETDEKDEPTLFKRRTAYY